MTSATLSSPQNLHELSRAWGQEKAALCAEIASLKHQLDWFKRQIFGQKSEKRLIDDAGQQMSLGEVIEVAQTGAPDTPPRIIPAHSRRTGPKAVDAKAEAIPFFDAARVPMEVIKLDTELYRLGHTKARNPTMSSD